MARFGSGSSPRHSRLQLAGTCKLGGRLPVRLEVDGDDHPPATAACTSENMVDCKAIEEDSINKDEQVVEGQALGLNSSVEEGSTQPEIVSISVDDVPNMNSPLGWTCLPEQFDDGETCDCDCGIWDPDCEEGAQPVFAIHSPSSNTLTLIDKEQAGLVLGILDGDGNANGVIDGSELTRLQSFGVSTLFGVAERIISAQEAGNNEGGAGVLWQDRLGNFAKLQASRAPHSCDALLQDEALLPSRLATYTPMCVKDPHFAPLVNQPTGRCALQPKMEVGSQCFVPGNGAPVSVAPANENGTMVKEPSAVSVCGLASRVFRSGQGVGGLRSAGVGISTAGLTIPGGEYLPGTRQESFDVLAGGLNTLSASLGIRGFSFFARVRFDRFHWDAPLFAFGNGFQSNHMVVTCRYDSSTTSGLRFTVATDARYDQLEVRNLLNAGQEAALLFSVRSDGRMTMWHGGVTVGTRDAQTIVHGPFSHMYIAGGMAGSRLPSGDGNRRRRRRRGAVFEGAITDVRIWDREVTWSEAVAGVPADQVALPDDDEEEESEVDVPCIASQQNTWDFVCDEVLPEELATEFGYGSGSSAEAQSEFETREDMGEVTVCGSYVSVKGYVFHGKFGDGLTAEYFRVRSGCGKPFLFGEVPHTIRVDPTVNFTGGFFAAYNEYAIRWTGKILIVAPGTYEFSLESKDGSWLAINEELLIDNSGCHSVRSHSESLSLDKGSYDIAVLLFNRGPAGETLPGWCKLTYKGPDTGGVAMLLPQEKLGSNPMRLSQIERHADAPEEEPQDVVPGHFVYDESNQLAVMPVGACDMTCRQGLRKEGAAPVKFFCSGLTEVSFVARVNKDADFAMSWMDEEPLQLWNLKQSAGTDLLQLGDDSAELVKNKHNRSAAGGATAADQAILSAMGSANEFDIVSSATSPVFSVMEGEHTLYVQGRVEDDQGFALQSLHFEKGVEACVFFLEGKDKTLNDCR